MIWTTEDNEWAERNNLKSALKFKDEGSEPPNGENTDGNLTSVATAATDWSE